MFLFLDESKEYPKKVFGGILLPTNKVSELEKDFTELRISQKLFGELKWEYVDLYYERYFLFLDLIFSSKEITYHSICFRRDDKRYNAAYSLIRTVTWKMENHGIKEPLYILFDNDGAVGKKEIEIIKKYANGDKRFKQKLEFCNQGHSHVLGALQLSDLMTGSVCSQINNIPLKLEKQALVDYITKKNNNIPLSYASPSLPSLFSRKIHYFDPDTKIISRSKVSVF